MIRSGQKFKLPQGHNEICEDCEDVVPAVYKVAGEIDSFGIEWWMVCEAHLPSNQPVVDDCEVCGTHAELVEAQDPEEGMAGARRMVCKHCYDEYLSFWDE